MRSPCVLVVLAVAVLAGPVPAFAGCGDPDAIGVSRTIVVNTSGGIEVGSMQHRGRLGLADNEVVLTFDDGPLPGQTARVLDALRDACTRATFFTVGRMARAAPGLLRREAAEGHTVATHSWSHPESLAKLSADAGAREIDRGIAAIATVLGRPPAPFFRFPGLGESGKLRRRLAGAGIGVFSADVTGSDWTGISADAVRRNVLRRLKARRGGILLLHDTKHATARMLPQLLRDMKAAGFRIVHIVPASSGLPAIAGAPDDGPDAPLVAGLDPH